MGVPWNHNSLNELSLFSAERTIIFPCSALYDVLQCEVKKVMMLDDVTSY